jgi:hypothetical protein
MRLRRRRRWRELQIRAHLIEFALPDSLDRQQVFDAVEPAALMAEIYDGLGSFGADAGNLLQFLDVRDVQIQRMRRRSLSRDRGKRTDRDKNGSDRGALNFFHLAPASTSSPWNRLSCICRTACSRLPDLIIAADFPARRIR